MKKALGCLGVLVVIGVVVGFMAVGRYNALVAGEQRVEEAWSQVQNVYQRRADLVPNLVETVKGSADFEQETLTAVVEARSRVGQLSTQASEDLLSDPQKFAQFQQAQDGLSSALSRLLVVVERYPEIQSTVAFRDLMTQLEGTENRIAVERRRFNEVARDFNTSLATFPTNVIARVLGWHFAKRPYFEAAAGAEQAPRVDFSGN
jgi:LemA protein